MTESGLYWTPGPKVWTHTSGNADINNTCKNVHVFFVCCTSIMSMTFPSDSKIAAELETHKNQVSIFIRDNYNTSHRRQMTCTADSEEWNEGDLMVPLGLMRPVVIYYSMSSPLFIPTSFAGAENSRAGKDLCSLFKPYETVQGCIHIQRMQTEETEIQPLALLIYIMESTLFIP